MPFQPISYTGTLHHYTPRLTAFEHQASMGPLAPQIIILFLGGIGDGFGFPQYPSSIARHLPPSWTIAEVILSSTYTGWTTSSLQKDAEGLANAVNYFRSTTGRSEVDGAKIVLMGHSTGSQICMEYLVGPWKSQSIPHQTLNRPVINGVILQAGASDREGLIPMLGQDVFDAGLNLAKQWVAEGRGEEILPFSATRRAFGADPCARRWVSLADIHGDDDYFSSDLSNDILDRTFGQVGKRGIPIGIFLSEKDEHMPEYVDKEALLARWQRAVQHNGGVAETGVILAASHNLNRESKETKLALAEMVSRFVEDRKAVGYESRTDISNSRCYRAPNFSLSMILCIRPFGGGASSSAAASFAFRASSSRFFAASLTAAVCVAPYSAMSAGDMRSVVC